MADLDPLREYERKFLVQDAAILDGSTGDRINQGYLWVSRGCALRVRILETVDVGGGLRFSAATMTLKGPRVGLARMELEAPLDELTARAFIAESKHAITKDRHQPIVSEGRAWVVDVFHGSNEGLVVAEYEGSRLDVERMKPPWWCGQEVTFDLRYANEELARNPWTTEDMRPRMEGNLDDHS